MRRVDQVRYYPGRTGGPWLCSTLVLSLFQAAITDLAARGAEVIVLACTEFGMVVQDGDSPVPVIDTTIAHAQAAAEMALADDPRQPGS